MRHLRRLGRFSESFVPAPRNPPRWRDAIPLIVFAVIFIGGCLWLEYSHTLMFVRPIMLGVAMLAPWFWWMHVAMMGRGDIFPIANGGESAVLFCFTFLYLVTAGPGAFAVDGLLKRNRAYA